MAIAGAMALVAALFWRPPVRDVTIQYVFSPDAKELLEPLIRQFNREEVRAGGGKVKVTWTIRASGTALGEMGKRTLKPVAWTPASSLWGELLNEKTGAKWVPDKNLSLVWSPQVVAVFETRMRDLGLTRSERFGKVLDLARLAQPDGLRFGHTDPNVSTSGLSSVLSEFYLATGKRGAELTLGDVADPSVREEIRKIEGSVVHYVDIAKDFKDLWCRYGAQFADAAYVQETTFLEFNRECERQLQAIYPSDLPFRADYPYIVLDSDRVDWVTPQQEEAAQAFGVWLDRSLSLEPNRVRANRFRKGSVVPEEVASSPAIGPPPARPLPEVLAALQHAWGQLRRPANIMLLVDESQRMAPEGRLFLARQALMPFLACPASQDRVGMITFGGQVESPIEVEVQMAGFDGNRTRLEDAILGLSAGRGRAVLYDAIEAALRDRSLEDPTAINTIVVLANAADDGSSTDAEVLIDRLKGMRVQILAIPYEKSEDTFKTLFRIVEASLGRYFSDDTSKTRYGRLDDIGDPGRIDRAGKFVCQFL